MNLIDYIRSNRRGKLSNQIERKALNDPFLSEAIEGFDSVIGNHAEHVLKLQKKVRCYRKPDKTINSVWRTIAAVVLLLMGFGGYVFIDSYQSKLLAKETDSPQLIQVFVPEEVFRKYNSAITIKNITAKKALQAELNSLKVQKEISLVIPEDEIEPSISTIDIYIPD